jgi:DNA-binding transcriptional ArsR family regulator
MIRKGIMNENKADLILHPVRYQIMQALVNNELTTQEISEKLPAIPTSSIYRHLRILLDAGMVEVADTNQVKAIEEKVYRLSGNPRILQEDIAQYSREEVKRYFAAYLSYLLSGFSNYVDSSDALDMEGERAGYTDVVIYASPEEFTELGAALNRLLESYSKNKPGKGRQRQVISIISFPVERKAKDNG